VTARNGRDQQRLDGVVVADDGLPDLGLDQADEAFEARGARGLDQSRRVIVVSCVGGGLRRSV